MFFTKLKRIKSACNIAGVGIKQGKDSSYNDHQQPNTRAPDGYSTGMRKKVPSNDNHAKQNPIDRAHCIHLNEGRLLAISYFVFLLQPPYTERKRGLAYFKAT